MAVGLVSRQLAERSVYLELILIFLGGVLGTGHHLYWAGEPGLWVPLGTMFSFIEVLPLVLLIIEAIQHHRLIKGNGEFKYGLAYLYVIGAAFWNFVGAGVFGGGTLNAPLINYYEHATFLTLNHAHTALFGAFGLLGIGLIYFCLRYIAGDAHAFGEKAGRWAFWLCFTGVHVCFLPMHLTGLMGMPRRVDTYLPDRAWDLPNLISTVGAFVMAAGVAVFLFDAMRCYLRHGSGGNARNVFNGGTLEWLSAGNYGVRSIPVVNDLEPLWADPQLAADVEAGRYFLPNTATGQQLLGTIAYLAPELVTRGTADARSDIYALGILLYEMLAGEQPYKGEQPMQIAFQHATESVPRPSVKNPGVPEQLDELVLWATEKDPDERPSDAGQMLERLKILANEPGKDRTRMTEFERMAKAYEDAGGTIPLASDASAALVDVRPIGDVVLLRYALSDRFEPAEAAGFRRGRGTEEGA